MLTLYKSRPSNPRERKCAQTGRSRSLRNDRDRVTTLRAEWRDHGEAGVSAQEAGAREFAKLASKPGGRRERKASALVSAHSGSSDRSRSRRVPDRKRGSPEAGGRVQRPHSDHREATALPGDSTNLRGPAVPVVAVGAHAKDLGQRTQRQESGQDAGDVVADAPVGTIEIRGLLDPAPAGAGARYRCAGIPAR
jgi:hypothetical protein